MTRHHQPQQPKQQQQQQQTKQHASSNMVACAFLPAAQLNVTTLEQEMQRALAARANVSEALNAAVAAKVAAEEALNRVLVSMTVLCASKHQLQQHCISCRPAFTLSLLLRPAGCQAGSCQAVCERT